LESSQSYLQTPTLKVNIYQLIIHYITPFFFCQNFFKIFFRLQSDTNNYLEMKSMGQKMGQKISLKIRAFQGKFQLCHMACQTFPATYPNLNPRRRFISCFISNSLGNFIKTPPSTRWLASQYAKSVSGIKIFLPIRL